MKTKINTTKTYTLEVTEEELQLLWHRLNLSTSKFEQVYTPDESVPYPIEAGSFDYRVWNTLDNLIQYERETG